MQEPIEGDAFLQLDADAQLRVLGDNRVMLFTETDRTVRRKWTMTEGHGTVSTNIFHVAAPRVARMDARAV